MRFLLLLGVLLLSDPSTVRAQVIQLKGVVTSGQGHALPFAHIEILPGSLLTFSDSAGIFEIEIPEPGTYEITASYVGFREQSETVQITHDSAIHWVRLELNSIDSHLSEVVVSGTRQSVQRLKSPVPVDVYPARYFKANPSPSIFEALQNVNGVRPQINCNVCNTGDIHINGLEGPYTMVLLDGLPLVSGLSTVYGLTGIPQSLIDRVEVIKGPASTLYGSDAVAGLINIITKTPEGVPALSLDLSGTSWGEIQTDLGAVHLGKKFRTLWGLHYYNYSNPLDKNGDGFTDVTLQDRISLFSKWTFDRASGRSFSLATRYLYEDRWGGQMSWSPEYRGGREIYGESIYTNRWELFGNYQLPLAGNWNFDFSANGHRQNSVYGATIFLADQQIFFGQLTWNSKKNSGSEQTAGLVYRYTYYDDNTPATGEEISGLNAPSRIHLPGIFLQTQHSLSPKLVLLGGARVEHNQVHGLIFSPRLNLKWNNSREDFIIRVSAGNGFRIANIFTEDHAALTGAREVIFQEKLQPEKSWNGNINIVKKIYSPGQVFWNLDASVFYTHFSNRIIPDYESDPNAIIYDNLDGYSISRGISFNVDFSFPSGINGRIGSTLQDVLVNEENRQFRQLLTEQFSGIWNIGYQFPKLNIMFDYTGNLYSPMRLPLQGVLDDRPEYSPWFSIQNVQITKKWNNWEIYTGLKNILNFTPPANSISRPFDPFDKEVIFDNQGRAVPTPSNPQGLTFDPTYVFAPNQGIRYFLGIRWTM